MMMVIIVNACPMCLNDEENVDHLPLNCRVAQGLWSILFSWFGCSSVLPSTICGLFENWHLVFAPIEEGRCAVCRTAFLAVLWTIWRERYSRTFENLACHGEILLDRLKMIIALWVSIHP